MVTWFFSREGRRRTYCCVGKSGRTAVRSVMEALVLKLKKVQTKVKTRPRLYGDRSSRDVSRPSEF